MDDQLARAHERLGAAARLSSITTNLLTRSWQRLRCSRALLLVPILYARTFPRYRLLTDQRPRR